MYTTGREPERLAPPPLGSFRVLNAMPSAADRAGQRPTLLVYTPSGMLPMDLSHGAAMMLKPGMFESADSALFSMALGPDAAYLVADLQVRGAHATAVDLCFYAWRPPAQGAALPP